MPDTSSIHGELDKLTPADLEMRRRVIVAEAKGRYDDLSLDLLRELAHITSILRRKTAGPPRVAKAAKKEPKIKLNLDDILAG